MQQTQCFARTITFPQLGEYVDSLPFETKWVERYNSGLVHVDDDTEEVVFVQMGPNSDLFQKLLATNKQIWILNMEQMSRVLAAISEKKDASDAVPFNFDAWIFMYLRANKNIGIMDYSLENIKIWKQLFPDTKTRHVPFLPKIDEGRIPKLCLKPDYDESTSILKPVVFIGDAQSKHRSELLTKLQDDVHCLTATFGVERDAQLRQFPILLNVHFGPSYTVFEEIRVLPAILRKQIVVSETSLIDPNHPIFPFVVFAPYDRLEQCVKSAVKHKEKLWTKLYENNPKWDTLLDDIKAFSLS